MARNTLVDQKPDLDIKKVVLKVFLMDCNDAFLKKENLVDSHKFLNSNQKESETLQQFWHVLNGLSANSGFGAQTEELE